MLILLADDAGWEDYDYADNRIAATPNIDSIVHGGQPRGGDKLVVAWMRLRRFKNE